MAPADHSDALWVEKRIALEHPLAPCIHVVDLAATVIDLVVEGWSITSAAAIVRRDHAVSSLNQFTEDVDVTAVRLAVNAPVREHDQRVLLRTVQFLGNQRNRVDDQRVACALCSRVRL